MIERWAAHWSAHDLERLLPLFSEDVSYEDVAMGAMNRGAAELRAFAEGVFSRFPDVTFELQCSFADGTRGGAEWVMRGTRDLRGMPPAPFRSKRFPHKGRGCHQAASGNSIRNVVPRPTSDLKSIEPFSNCTIRNALANPIPLPPGRVVKKS